MLALNLPNYQGEEETWMEVKNRKKTGVVVLTVILKTYTLRHCAAAELAIMLPWGSCCYSLTFIFKDVLLSSLCWICKSPGAWLAMSTSWDWWSKWAVLQKLPFCQSQGLSLQKARALHHTFTIDRAVASVHLNLHTHCRQTFYFYSS